MYTYRIAVSDASYENISAHFTDTSEFIDLGLKQSNSGVLVHCNEGRSRSVAVIIAYLVQQHKWDLQRAYKHMTEKSETVNLNDGFKRQLMDFEVQCLGSASFDFFFNSPRRAGSVIINRSPIIR